MRNGKDAARRRWNQFTPAFPDQISRLVLIALLAAGNCRSGPIDSAIIAAMKLAEHPNYAWTSTVMDDAQVYTVEGKTVDGSWTWMRMPMGPSVGALLDSSPKSEMEAIFNGAANSVIWTAKGWQTYGELPRWESGYIPQKEPLLPPPPISDGRRPDPSGSGSDPGDPFATEEGSVTLPNHSSTGIKDGEADPYSNAQFALGLPHEDLATIISSYKDMRVDGEIVSGTLTDLGAQLLLVRDGPEDIRPVIAGGDFKLQVKGGRVVRFLLQLEGILDIRGKRFHVHQVSNTVLKDIGTTELEIPDEARRKCDP